MHLSDLPEGIGQYDFLPQSGSKAEAIFDILWQQAREHFPEDTAKAEAWLQRQAMRYGLARAKEYAVDISQNALVWLIGGLALGWLLTRRR